MPAFAWPHKGKTTMGKLPILKSSFLHLRMATSEVAALRELAAELGLTLSELVRLLVSRGLENIIAPEQHQ